MGATCNYSVHYWKQAAEEAHDSNHKAPLLGATIGATGTQLIWRPQGPPGIVGFAKTCITATGSYDHTKTSMKTAMDEPFVTCWQSDSGMASNNYCWSNSYDAGSTFNDPVGENSAAQCVPKGQQWESVEWQYVNPHRTCGSPCDSMWKYDAQPRYGQ